MKDTHVFYEKIVHSLSSLSACLPAFSKAFALFPVQRCLQDKSFLTGFIIKQGSEIPDKVDRAVASTTFWVEFFDLFYLIFILKICSTGCCIVKLTLQATIVPS